MPKIRGVKPDYWTDEAIVELSIPARLLFIGLWNYACDNGHVQDKSKQIKMRVLPTDEVNCAELLREIEAQKLIQRLDGWITIPNLTHHQKPHKRWFVTCEKADCAMPEGATYGYSKPETTVAQPLNNECSTVEQPLNNGCSTVDVDVDVDVDGDGDGELMVIREGASDSPKVAGKPATNRKHQLPDDFAPNDTNRRIATERGLDLRAVFEQFADHHRAKGNTMVDWHRAFNSWLRRERATTSTTPAVSNAQRWLTLANETAEAEGVINPFPHHLGGAS